MKHSYKGRNYWKSGCSFVGNDVLSTRQSWVDRKGRQTHTAVKLSLNTSAWMTEWTLNSDYLSPHPETLLLGWWAKLLRLFDMWDGINEFPYTGRTKWGDPWEAPDTQSSDGQQQQLAALLPLQWLFPVFPSALWPEQTEMIEPHTWSSVRRA